MIPAALLASMFVLPTGCTIWVLYIIVQRMLNLHDKGYNAVYRKSVRADGRIKQIKIGLYTSGGTGTQIRDAETGHFYNRFVGSKHEDGFFKVSLATCTHLRGSPSIASALT